MALKLFLNILYTIGIVVCVVIAYWSFNHQRYDFLAGAVIVAGVFVMLKINLLKQVRAMQNPVKK